MTTRRLAPIAALATSALLAALTLASTATLAAEPGDLQLSLVGSPATVAVDGAVTYAATVTNSGPTDADGVFVTLAVLGADPVFADPAWVCSADAPPEYRCRLASGTLGAGESAVLTASVVAPSEPTEIVVDATALCCSPAVAASASVVTSVIAAPDPSPSESASPTASPSPSASPTPRPTRRPTPPPDPTPGRTPPLTGGTPGPDPAPGGGDPGRTPPLTGAGGPGVAPTPDVTPPATAAQRSRERPTENAPGLVALMLVAMSVGLAGAWFTRRPTVTARRVDHTAHRREPRRRR